MAPAPVVTIVNPFHLTDKEAASAVTDLSGAVCVVTAALNAGGDADKPREEYGAVGKFLGWQAQADSKRRTEAWARLVRCAASAEWQREERERERLNKDRAAINALAVNQFLAKNRFRGVNAPRRRVRQLLASEYPLHCAVRCNDAQLVCLLVAAGADVRSKNSSGLTPGDLERAKKTQHPQVLRTLFISKCDACC